MVKKKPFIVKQPELGQKILELRRAKGLTQEELVNKCNINVRTIQRIEAGEVTPRSYTVKIILEALGYDLNTIRFLENDGTSNVDVGPHSQFLKVSFFMGIIYFTLSFVESFLDLRIWGLGFPIATFHNIISFTGYVSVKGAVLITYAGFMIGYFRLSFYYPNVIIRTASLLLVGMTLVSMAVDVYSFYTEEPNSFYLLMQAVAFGMIYIVFGIGMIKYRNTFGELTFFGGITGLVAGIALMTVVLSLPGLVLVAVFEILQLVLLYRAVDRHKPEAGLASVTL